MMANVLVSILLLWKDTMTTEGVIKESIYLGLVYSFRGLAHFYHGENLVVHRQT